jgi:hypothetical protein
MLKKTITYTDYDGNERTEDFYFNISKAEFAELDMSTPGGFTAKMKVISDRKDIPAMIKTFRELIAKAYGVKSLDGRRMEKSEELSREFMETEAYSELFTEIFQNVDSMASFIVGIMPVDSETAQKAIAATKEQLGVSDRPQIVDAE